MGSVNVQSGSVEVLDKVDGDLNLANGATVRAKDSKKSRFQASFSLKVQLPSIVAFPRTQ